MACGIGWKRPTGADQTTNGDSPLFSSLSSPGYPRIYSGTRLDYNAMTEDEERLKKFKAGAPEYPLIDFPVSFILETLIFPTTFPVATYEFLFE
jgi:uncharacterized protein YceK